jgi:hypothetical protein
MKKNLGLVDRIVRIAFAATILVLYLAGQLSTTAAIVLGVLSAVFIATSVVGVCPLYRVLGISSRRKSAT